MILHPQELIAEYRMAFRICNPGKPDPNIVYDHGWFKFADWAGRNYRRADFYKMLETLRQRSNTGRDSIIADSQYPQEIASAPHE